MCARFELLNPLSFRDPTRFPLTDALLLAEDRPDIRPTQVVPVIAAGVAGRVVAGMRWGLVPHWANDIRMGAKAINARAEGIEDKPYFRGPRRRSRCLIPATALFRVAPGGIP